MGTSRFPLFGLPSAGSRPGGRPTFLRRQESRQRSDPCFTGLLLKRCLIKRLPCAARPRRPARNSRAAPAQTAAPDIPAGFCAARRLRRGFPEPPSVAGRAGVIGGKAKGGRWVMGNGEWGVGSGEWGVGSGEWAPGAASGQPAGRNPTSPRHINAPSPPAASASRLCSFALTQVWVRAMQVKARTALLAARTTQVEARTTLV